MLTTAKNVPCVRRIETVVQRLSILGVRKQIYFMNGKSMGLKNDSLLSVEHLLDLSGPVWIVFGFQACDVNMWGLWSVETLLYYCAVPM